MNTRPPAILAVGRNYPHPGGPPPPDHVVFFLKNPASIIGDGTPIIIPEVCSQHGMQVDFEAELAVELAVDLKDASAAEVRAGIARYLPANDVTCRWWEQHGAEGQLARGKSFDTFCPLGDGAVATEIEPDRPRRLISRLNGEVMQDACVTTMFRTVEELLMELSRGATLLAGSVLLTGTPAGIGMSQDPPRFLRDGDIVEVELEGVGSIANPVQVDPG